MIRITHHVRLRSRLKFEPSVLVLCELRSIEQWQPLFRPDSESVKGEDQEFLNLGPQATARNHSALKQLST